MLGRKLCGNERQIAKRKGIVNRFKGRVIKNLNGRFNNYAISLIIRQVFMHWDCELVENELFFVHMKINYHQSNREKLSEKTKDRFHIGGSKQW